MTFRGKKLSDPSVRDVLLADVTDPDYLYFVDAETGETMRVSIAVLRSAIGSGGAPAAHAASHMGGSDPVTPAGIGAATVVAVATAQTTANNATTAITTHAGLTTNPHSVTAVQVGALPAPGGTTTANGIVQGSGTAGNAVTVSTTTIADLVKRLGLVFTLSADTVLDDTYSGAIIFTDTSADAHTHTIPPTVGSGWNAIFVREGANTLNIVGSTVGPDTMLLKGPAAVANAVAIGVDDGGVSVLRRSATKCWCAGVIA